MIALGCLLLALAAPTIKAASVTCNEFAMGRRTFTDDPPYAHLPLPLCPSQFNPTYTMFTRTTPQGQALTDTIVPTGFNPAVRTFFVLHGWSSDSSDCPWMYDIKDNYLQVGDYNVVIVDWGGITNNINYNLCASTTRTNGAWMAVVMENLVSRGQSWSNIHCMGHSVGGHSCGQAGRWVNGVLGRITTFDPTGPMFQNQADVTVGVNSNDAIFVDIMHCDDDQYGGRRRLGHMDFYPNDGKNQPNCLLNVSYCSHERCNDLYAVSILNDCFASRETCFDEYNLPGSCTTHPTVRARMGAWAEGSGANGLYRLDTTGKDPYCLG